MALRHGPRTAAHESGGGTRARQWAGEAAHEESR